MIRFRLVDLFWFSIGLALGVVLLWVTGQLGGLVP